MPLIYCFNGLLNELEKKSWFWYAGNHAMNEKGLHNFLIVVSEVSFFVGNPIIIKSIFFHNNMVIDYFHFYIRMFSSEL